MQYYYSALQYFHFCNLFIDAKQLLIFLFLEISIYVSIYTTIDWHTVFSHDRGIHVPIHKR